MDDETKQILVQAVSALARHGLTILSGILVTSGFLQSSQSANFTEIGVGIVAAIVGLGWSLANKRTLVKAANK